MEKYRYEDLTWPEVNEAARAGRIPVLPVGATEQHGHHLPIKVDRWLVTSVVDEAARRRPDRLLTMPSVPYGYTTATMDFPGTITIHHETFMRYVIDVLKSLSYHGFRKMIVVNGHGSNMPPLDLACRRANMETGSQVALAAWWGLTAADPEFMETWRRSRFPGGCSHACEAETSVALHLDPGLVKMDLAVNELGAANRTESKYLWGDLWAHGPVSITRWHGESTESGVSGEARLATAEKGKAIFEEAVKRLIEFADEFHARPDPVRRDHHDVRPLSKLPG
ncbi:MAG: creatininase family protein [Gemmatimonadetes bacterium]|nr:creatininase family protein [Gemmatimonadota bacterium]